LSDPKATWLPNLVGGISIWKLAQDLNAARLFDGRLLVPETEGSDCLPVKVTWDLKDVLPLPEARGKHAAEVEQGLKDFGACLERVAKEFGDEKSGYHKFKEALTMPGGLGGITEGESYFYDPKSKKVVVINWGASPRAIAGQEVHVFGWVDWASLAAAGAAGAVTASTTKSKDASKPEEKKEEEKKKKDDKPGPLLWGRPLWQWALAALLALVLVLVVLFLLRSCDKGAGTKDASVEGATFADGAPLPDGATLLADGGLLLADGAVVPFGGDGGDASADATVDGSTDGATGDGGPKDASSDARKDGGLKRRLKDGGIVIIDDSDGDPIIIKGGGPGGGFIILGSDGKPKQLPHRTDFQPDAVKWRIAEGVEFLHPGSPADGAGTTFTTVLRRDASFDDVRVEWQDKSGDWHTF